MGDDWNKGYREAGTPFENPFATGVEKLGQDWASLGSAPSGGASLIGNVIGLGVIAAVPAVIHLVAFLQAAAAWAPLNAPLLVVVPVVWLAGAVGAVLTSPLLIVARRFGAPVRGSLRSVWARASLATAVAVTPLVVVGVTSMLIAANAPSGRAMALPDGIVAAAGRLTLEVVGALARQDVSAGVQLPEAAAGYTLIVVLGAVVLPFVAGASALVRAFASPWRWAWAAGVLAANVGVLAAIYAAAVAASG